MGNEAAVTWKPRDAWHGILDRATTSPDGGLSITPIYGRSLIHLSTAQDDHDAFAQAVRAIFGAAPPATPRRIKIPGLDLSWAGPHQWMLSFEDRTIGFDAIEKIQSWASLTDLTGSRAIISIAGPQSGLLLAKGCPIDLHPRVFKPDDVALTMIGHINVQLCQTGGEPSYEITLFRSLAKTFWSWLSAAALSFELTGDAIPT
jgi:sarcosine oxidase subunit gamma